MKSPPLHQATATLLHPGLAFDELDPDEPPPLEDQQSDVFPDFVPSALAAAIPLARRSIRILESSELSIDLTRLSDGSSCSWSWGRPVSAATGDIVSPRLPTQSATSVTRSYEPELSGLGIFDLEPGSAEAVLPDRPDFRELDAFIDAFPSTTALVSPTLRFTAEATVRPVIDHTRMLSRQLLLLFLQSSNVHGHLCILRDYLLAANHSFKDLLVNALCSTAIQSNAVQQANRFMQIRRRTVHVRQKRSEEEQAFHGVGLSLGGYNIAHTDWPPGAADISFSLRRVIVDSLDASGQTLDEDSPALPAQLERGGVIWSEAEARLGFGLRDIPNDAVTEGWFNQDGSSPALHYCAVANIYSRARVRSMHVTYPYNLLTLWRRALDFLYLTYRPPQPLDQVMLSADIMSKYQRCFAFLLRLFRGTPPATHGIITSNSPNSGTSGPAHPPTCQRSTICYERVAICNGPVSTRSALAVFVPDPSIYHRILQLCVRHRHRASLRPLSLQPRAASPSRPRSKRRLVTGDQYSARRLRPRADPFRRNGLDSRVVPSPIQARRSIGSSM